jgi:hypothetical protein
MSNSQRKSVTGSSPAADRGRCGYIAFMLARDMDKPSAE